MPTIDREPRTWWDERWPEQTMTRCIACGFEPFFYVAERECPHLCLTCADAASRHPAWLAHTAGLAQDQGPRQVQADAAASYRDPTTGRQAFAVADGIGDDYDPADGAHLTVWAAAAAATTASAPGGLHIARECWHRRYDPAPPGQKGNAVAVVAVPVDADHGGGYDIAWCGDARAYAYTDGDLTQLTTDHTEAELMRAKGMPAEWIGPRAENTVTASIGYGVIASVRALAPVGRLLLCTDGVYRKLTPAAIARALRTFTDPHEATRRLVRAARRRGSTDNATALVIDPPQPRHATPETITRRPSDPGHTASDSGVRS